mgnify:CR=1 FL=1
MKLDTGKINFSIGGQFGSEGKGVLNSWLSLTNHIDIAISRASSNAGHTMYRDGKKYILKYLPVSSIMNDRSMIYLCHGAIIHPPTLLTEIAQFDIDPNRIHIHPMCAIITSDDINHERDITSSVSKIASTQSGVGSALANKINRSSKLAKDIPELYPFIRELNLHKYLDEGCTALMEIPQGFSLSLSSEFYPHVTSREVTISAALADADVHPSYLGKVACCLRIYPIRVGNLIIDGVEVGNSGLFYDDSVETSWEAIGVPAEKTTVTGRIRKVASFSMKQYRRMLDIIRPDYILLNFANYMNREELIRLLDQLPEVSHLGFGPTYDKVVLNNIT